MPTRTIPIATDEYYHIYNRGVARQPVFSKKRDYEHFLTTISYYRFAQPPMRLSLFLELAEPIREGMFKRLETTERLVDTKCRANSLREYNRRVIVKQKPLEGRCVWKTTLIV